MTALPAWLTGAADETVDQIRINAMAVLYDWSRDYGELVATFKGPREFRAGTLVGEYVGGAWKVRHEKVRRIEVELGALVQVKTSSWDPRGYDTRKPTVEPVRWERPEISRRVVDVDDPAMDARAAELEARLNAGRP